MAVGVWVGNTDNKQMNKMPGTLGGAPIFHQMMVYAMKDKPVERWAEPPGMARVTVCIPSGLLPTDDCPDRKDELFIAGTEPTAYDTVHRAFEVNKETGKLATQYTPRDLVERRVYTLFPPEAADWVRESNIPQPPTQYDDAYGPGDANPEVAIIQPGVYSYVRGIISVVGNAQMGDFRSYRVEFGEGLNPGAWTQIGPEHNNTVSNGPLEYWDTAPFNGLYTLRLIVTRGDGNVSTATTQVTVDNAPPKVELLHPPDAKLYVMEDDEWVSITADATDDWSMDRVDFFMDGKSLGTSTVAPYSLRWTISMTSTVTETHMITVTAFDSAGNQTVTPPVKIEVINKQPETKPAGALLGPGGAPVAILPPPDFGSRISDFGSLTSGFRLPTTVHSPRLTAHRPPSTLHGQVAHA